MTDYRTAGKQLQEEFLSAVRNSQNAVLDAIETWASTVRQITPSVPELNVPFAEKLPKPQDLVSNAYDFAEKLLASQRKFAEDVLEATAMLPSKDDAPAKKTTAAK
ncbi:MAG TPA: hypothetical protein VGL63_02025 [Streptosporangiaceae bacterium]